MTATVALVLALLLYGCARLPVDVGRLVLWAARRLRAKSLPPPPVNFIGGAVLPAPHDPRWEIYDAGLGWYLLRLDETTVVRVGKSCVWVDDTDIATVQEAENYNAAIRKARIEAAKQRVTAKVESLLLG